MRHARPVRRLPRLALGVAAVTALALTTSTAVYAASSSAPPLVLCLDKKGNASSPASGTCANGDTRREVATQASLDEVLATQQSQAARLSALESAVTNVRSDLTSAQQGLATQSDALATLRSDLAATRSALSTTTSGLATLTTGVAALRSDLQQSLFPSLQISGAPRSATVWSLTITGVRLRAGQPLTAYYTTTETTPPSRQQYDLGVVAADGTVSMTTDVRCPAEAVTLGAPTAFPGVTSTVLSNEIARGPGCG